MTAHTLEKQIAFILELDKLKSILRRTHIPGAGRHENSAEHSWQLALAAILLAEHANLKIDTVRAMKMLLVHDIVEIDAGDTFCYDETGNRDKPERERAAADRIFGLLPPDQEKELRSLWEDFEAGESPEAKFAAGLDRLLPLLHNYHTRGKSWIEHGISKEQVIERNRHMRDGSEELWKFTENLIEDAVRKGYLPE